MTTIKIFGILICLLSYSCRNNSEGQIKDTREMSKRDIDKLEHYSKTVEERKIDPELLGVWNRFIEIAESKNYSELLSISLDTIEACHANYKAEDFIYKCLPNVFDTTLVKRFSEVAYSRYLDKEVISSYMPQFLLKEIASVGGNLKLNQFQVLKELTPEGGWTMTFDFVKTKAGYKFLSCDSYGGPICCR